MKFTGQVRVPEVDHPGVPATIVVEEGQTEVFLEGESLGRWSLFDVHASRLVSSAFSLSLGGEEITFIADEPVDFAYKGVDHMAEVWARYKSMTIPRRVVAVGRSRRGTVPSRITELREAMLQNLESAGRGSARLVPVERSVEPPESPSWTRRIDAYSNVPQPLDLEVEPREPVAEEPLAEEPVAESAVGSQGAVVESDPVIEEAPVSPEARAQEPPSTPRAPLRPGPGLIPRKVEPQPVAELPDQLSAAPLEQQSSWDEPPIEEPREYEEVASDADPDYTDVELESPSSAGDDEPVEFAEEPADIDVPGPVEAAETEPEADEEPRPEVVVDLAHLEEGDQGDVPAAAPDPLQPDLELLFAGAPAPAAERSGLLGAVRSAFARNKTAHDHEFVEAPGGIGIVRQICAECGYISIGVSD